MPQVQAIERVVDLTDPARNVIYNMTVDEARALVASGDAAAVRRIDGDFALVGDRRRPRPHGPLHRPAAALLHRQARAQARALIAADRIDAIHGLSQGGRAWPTSSTRRTRAWSPPTTSPTSPSSAAPTRTRPTRRFFDPRRNALPRRPRRHRRGLHRAAAATRSPSGCRCARPTARSASASPAASTAARSSSSPITPCCGSA